MKIEAQRGKQNKIHIQCDGAYVATVDAEYWLSSPYSKMKSIDDPQAQAAFLEAVRARCAFLAGLRLLSVRDYGVQELVRKLITKGHDRKAAEAAAAKLEEYGYLNDRRFAEGLARRLTETKGMSLRGVQYELSRRGVSRDLCNEITETLDFDPVLRIIELLQTKYSRALQDEKGRHRAVAALQRLGYGWQEIRAALQRLETEDEWDDV